MVNFLQGCWAFGMRSRQVRRKSLTVICGRKYFGPDQGVIPFKTGKTSGVEVTPEDAVFNSARSLVGNHFLFRQAQPNKISPRSMEE